MILLALVILTIFAVLNALPLAFFVMLFLGNLGIHLGFLAVLPGALALNVAKNSLFSLNNNLKSK